MSAIVRGSLVGALVLIPVFGTAQTRPNFAGDWTLVSATTSGTRSTGEAGKSNVSSERPTTSNTISGAAFNCGRQCTIVHKSQTLTIDRALLSSNTTAAPEVTLQLNGRQMSVIDSFTPGQRIPVTAEWKGDTLEIISLDHSHSLTQAVSIQAGQLVVVTSVDRPSVQPVTFRYKQRKEQAK